MNPTENTVNSNRILTTPSSFAKTSLLHLQEVGNLHALRPHTSSRTGLDSYLFFTVTAGEGNLLYDGFEYPLTAGASVFIDCSKSYSHSTQDNLWSLKWCHFNGPEMKSIYDKYLSRGGKPFFYSSTDYDSIVEQLYKTADSDSYVKDMEINSLLSKLLTYLMADAWNPENTIKTGKKKDIVKVRNYIDENYREKITLDLLSELFFIDKFYLCEQFKEQFGSTVNDYINLVRITEAKKLLRFTQDSTEQIAEKIGVNGAPYFSRMFKKIEGVSPSEYRKMW